MWFEVNVRLSKITDLKWPHGTEWQCGNSTLAMSWPNHVQILSFASMASRQGVVKHRFVSKIAGGCSSYDVIAPWPDLTWSIFFYQKLRKVCSIRYPKTRRRYAPPFFRYLRKTSGGGLHQPPPLSGRGLTGKNQWLITHFLPPPANPAGQRPQPVEVSECNKELHANIYSKKYS